MRTVEFSKRGKDNVLACLDVLDTSARDVVVDVTDDCVQFVGADEVWASNRMWNLHQRLERDGKLPDPAAAATTAKPKAYANGFIATDTVSETLSVLAKAAKAAEGQCFDKAGLIAAVCGDSLNLDACLFDGTCKARTATIDKARDALRDASEAAATLAALCDGDTAKADALGVFKDAFNAGKATIKGHTRSVRGRAVLSVFASKIKAYQAAVKDGLPLAEAAFAEAAKAAEAADKAVADLANDADTATRDGAAAAAVLARVHVAEASAAVALLRKVPDKDTPEAAAAAERVAAYAARADKALHAHLLREAAAVAAADIGPIDKARQDVEAAFKTFAEAVKTEDGTAPVLIDVDF